MNYRTSLAREAASAAAKLRSRLGIERTKPVCAFDAADKLGVQVHLMSLPSAEGIYCRDRGPAIIISTDRPSGRQNFTCAHELGHHVFGHGTRSDEYLDGGRAGGQFDPEEFLADVFAGHFLMSAAAVRTSFESLGRAIEAVTSSDVFAAACMLGVGYSALIEHMQIGLGIISNGQASLLLKSTPKQIREGVLGRNDLANLVIASPSWTLRPIDLRVGDGLLLPEDTVVEGQKLKQISGSRGLLTVASQSGLGRVEHLESGWSCFVRVMKCGYEGLARFRFEEDVIDEHSFAGDDR